MNVFREWRHFTYPPRAIRFSRQSVSSPQGKDVTGGIDLPQFSAATVPKVHDNEPNFLKRFSNFCLPSIYRVPQIVVCETWTIFTSLDSLFSYWCRMAYKMGTCYVRNQGMFIGSMVYLSSEFIFLFFGFHWFSSFILLWMLSVRNYRDSINHNLKYPTCHESLIWAFHRFWRWGRMKERGDVNGLTSQGLRTVTWKWSQLSKSQFFVEKKDYRLTCSKCYLLVTTNFSRTQTSIRKLWTLTSL